MLVLSLKPGERLKLTLEDGREIFVTFFGIRWDGSARIGIDAPRSIPVFRSELLEKNRLPAN